MCFPTLSIRSSIKDSSAPCNRDPSILSSTSHRQHHAVSVAAAAVGPRRAVEALRHARLRAGLVDLLKTLRERDFRALGVHVESALWPRQNGSEGGLHRPTCDCQHVALGVVHGAVALGAAGSGKVPAPHIALGRGLLDAAALGGLQAHSALLGPALACLLLGLAPWRFGVRALLDKNDLRSKSEL